MIKKNYKSDFEFLLRIKSFGPETVEIDGDNTRVLFPNYDFTGILSTGGRAGQTYAFSRVGDRFVNCSRDGDLLRVVLNNHGLDPGQMTLEWHARIPNTSFPDGYEDISPKFRLPIELVCCAGDCECTPAEVIDVLMPLAMITAYETAVSLGYTGTQEEYEAALADMPQATLAAREAGQDADAAADRAATAASSAEKAVDAANTATEAANNATDAANTAASNANQAAGRATNAASSANQAAGRATNAANEADSAKDAANTAASSANQAAQNVTQAINTANTAANAANAAADRADATTNLFSDYAEGKRKIADAITTQGVPTAEDDTMSQMAENIRQLYLPSESDFWKAFGYETEADFSGGLGEMFESMQRLIDQWNTGQFINNISSWISTYTPNKNKLVICPKVDTSKVVNMSYMFQSCGSLQSIPQLDTSNVVNMSYMFQSCGSLQSIPQLDTSKVTNMNYMFQSCSSLQSIPQLDTSNVTNMNHTFFDCGSLQSIPQLDTSNVVNMGYMFQGCGSLQSIPQLDTSKVTNMNYMFQGCGSLQSIPQLDTSKVTNMNSMFQSCSSLQSIPQLDTSKVTNMNSMFQGCSSLRELKLSNLHIGIDLRWSPLLENDSIRYIIENSAATKAITITLHAEAYNRAIADELIQSALEAHTFVSLAKA